MATMLKEVDAVCIGVGFTGSILARELTKAGLKVVGLERGANRSAREDFVLPSVRDDLKMRGAPGAVPGHAAGDGWPQRRPGGDDDRGLPGLL
jgi:choline dehydrogenase-like flavoprotein